MIPFQRKIAMLRAILLVYVVVFIVFPVGGPWLGFDPWPSFLAGLVLAAALTFAIVALVGFQGKLPDRYQDEP